MSDHPDPNVVLCGGPFDGERIQVDSWAPVSLEAGGRTFVYRPTGDKAGEYGQLAVYIVASDLPTWPTTLG